jgi:predicted metal-dependent phosphoesterase TrpH
MHLHTVHSDGARLPEELVAAARAAKLDFVASTEHNTSSAAGSGAGTPVRTS